MKPLYCIIIFFCIYKMGFPQSLAINTDGSTANTSALLDVKSTSKGLLIPRLSKTQKNAIAIPATGLLIFQNAPDSVGFQYYDGTKWLWLSNTIYTDSTMWQTHGNTALDDNSYLGHKDTTNINFKIANTRFGTIDFLRRNIFLGRNAGSLSAAPSGSIAIGDSAGSNYIASNGNSVFIGFQAGKLVSTGFNNNMIGRSSGANTTFGSSNNFFGGRSGFHNTIGDGNTFIGVLSGEFNVEGNNNTALGLGSLRNNINGNRNTGIGYLAIVGDDSLVNAAAIGSLSQVDTSNALVLGSINGVNTAIANVNVAIGTTKPKAALHVSRGPVNGLTIPANRRFILEDTTNSYIQLLHGNTSETGIISGNEFTVSRSSIIFGIDSSIRFRTGGNSTRATITTEGRVGIRSTAPTSTFDVNGSTSAPLSLISTNTTLDEFDYTAIINATSGILVTLPAANTCSGRIYVIVNQDGFLHGISDYRDFTNTGVTTIPSNTSITIQSNGTNWYRIR
jgi:hypothetical protein